MKYDFSGYATKNDVRCADGRIIRQNAFKECDGATVPLVYQHVHDDPNNVLGHAVLENREDGVYTYGYFNSTEQGLMAKELVKHGDVKSLSIYANKLSQNGDNVTHGVIREVSLVLSGANPEATIENIAFAHGDGYEDISEEEAVIHFNEELELFHSDVYVPRPKPALVHAEDGEDEGGSDDETIQDVIDSMTPKQRTVTEYLIGLAVEEAEDDSDDSEEGADMKHNVFDIDEVEENVLSHDAMKAIIDEGIQCGSMRQAFNNNGIDGIEAINTLAHSIDNIDVLYPEAKTVTPTPILISRRMEWVTDWWNGVTKTPFAKIKSTAADITEDEARAKGYIKGNEKVEETFDLLTRTTTPQTVYKKQGMDRDDIIDITDFDVIAFLKAEMRMMLDEEVARAGMVGDGRLSTSKDKIKEDKIRPIYQDADLYTIHHDVTYPSTMTDPNDRSSYIVDQALRSRENYRGSGLPTFYATVSVINDMLLAKDKVGRRLYNTEAELASALRVARVVEVPVFDGVTRTDDDGNKHELVGLIVNLRDYRVGTDRGGEVNFFDDFDIDFNKEKYLIETRVSGALVTPYSAIALEKDVTTDPVTPPTPPTGGGDDENNVG